MTFETIQKTINENEYLKKILSGELCETICQDTCLADMLHRLLEMKERDHGEFRMTMDRDKPCPISDDLPLYLPVYQNFFEHAQKSISDMCESRGLSEHIIGQLSDKLIRHLQWIYLRCLIQDMHNVKNQKKLKGSDEQEEYQYYLERYLKSSEYQAAFLKRYPTILPVMFEKTEKVAIYIDKILRHLEKDHREIVHTLCRDHEFQSVVDMQLGMSDEHCPGQTVAKLRFDNGYTIYHKPRSLKSAVNFEWINRWLCVSCGLKHYHRALIDCADYGWEAEVTFQSCQQEEEVERFYRRMGMQLCLAYVLHISDLHYENMVVHGEYPVLIDLEVFPNRKTLKGSSGQSSVLWDTVMNAGILPDHAWDRPVNAGLFGEQKEQKFPFKMPRIINRHRSDMQVAYDYPAMSAKNILPVQNGYTVDYWQYISSVLSGFTEAYRTIMERREEFKNLVNPVAEQKSRYLFRHTQEYVMYQNISNFPELMQKKEHRYLVLLRMNQNLSCQEKHRYRILEYEMESIYQMCIPVFYVQGNILYMGNGEKISGYFTDSVQEMLFSKIEHLSERDLALQRKVILTSFLPAIKNPGDGTAQPQKRLNLPELATPCAIADHLLENRYEEGENGTWFGIGYGREGRVYLEPVDMYLYRGICGIAVFMTAVNRQYPCEKYQEACKQLTKKLFCYTDEWSDEKKRRQRHRWGLFTGEASFVYTYLLLYRIKKDERYLEYADRHGRIVCRHLENVKENDLLDGKAGVMLALISLYEQTGKNRYLDAAMQAAELLIETAVLTDEGIGWLTEGQAYPLAGMAHGCCGIALAFARLWKMTKNKRYHQVVVNAIKYENLLYDEESGNWKDLRNNKEGTQDTSAWCHGAPGILAARLTIRKIMDLSAEQLLLPQALKKTQETYKASECLCHGNMGIQEILRYASVGRQEKYYSTCNIFCLSLEDYLNPGFMTGLSGIGYALLCKDIHSLPDVMCLC
ncbi:type 2 lanthipeptide synthetase LanM [Ruminococcus sp. OA3]|uniref:type 2 lanthipeptide synthetase LanM n=1 Tax=Ruminococcus sp. OA3 TaxID=2914164 RepID=UPI001F055DDB|nr:type 2 lanthipeptide synthetase LanM [Ruminococcus sp. OA3]MCH1984505.1 type 2 lanthipeptide synthetase LanM [Ruminococcus sp. OA3]